jgi:hypothetical protein
MLAGRAKSLGEREAAAQRVPIGVLVAEDEDLVVRIDELFDLVVAVGGGAFGGGYEDASSPPSCGRTSFRSSLMCTLYSIEGSSSKRRSGENLRF